MKRGYFEFKTLGKVKKLRLYPMRAKKLLKDYPEANERQRVVVSLEKAEKMVEKDLREVIRRMRKRL